MFGFMFGFGFGFGFVFVFVFVFVCLGWFVGGGFVLFIIVDRNLQSF